ncbi:MAG: adenosylmethionine--8-amino-7-oxononanoate transaminase [Candidatus Omnitrophica bacterium]|nr:adenosylmethionine--8-amino-7-oxononanoate transaminase [Candidatus Omnitrophota bacterium]
MPKVRNLNLWLKKDLQYNWHPYTQMKDCRQIPNILIEKARGLKLFDAKGRFYYDTISSWWCNVHGHNHPYIKKAIKTQLERLEHVLFAGFIHKPAILLAEGLIAIAPKSLKKVFYSDNGSTAVEVALKMSFQYWQNTGMVKKKKFVSLDMGYHGDTIGTMSLSGIDLFNRVFSPLFFLSYKIPSPYCYRCPMGKNNQSCTIECIKPLEKLLERNSDEISGIILEPMVLCAAGMLVYPAQYLEKVAMLARRFKVHLILDEVATGFGRTGKMFAAEHAGVMPDFLCLSKGITAGYLPLGATLTTDKIYNAFYADYCQKKTFFHGHTYTANPLACSAALASLELFKREKTLLRINRVSSLFAKEMEFFRRLDFVGDVRYIGLIGALELVRNKERKEPFDFKERIGLKVYQKGLENNLVLRPLGNIIYLFLPLCVREKELNDIFKRVQLTFMQLQGEGVFK